MIPGEGGPAELGRGVCVRGGGRITGRPLGIEVVPRVVVFAIGPIVVDVHAHDEQRFTWDRGELLDEDATVHHGLDEALGEEEGVAVEGPGASRIAQAGHLPVISNQLRVPSRARVS